MDKFAAGVFVGASLGAAVAAATNSSLGKLDNLRLAAGAFHWKCANKILAQVARGLDISSPPAPALIAYLDKLYLNLRHGDFDVGIVIELTAMRGNETGVK